MPESIDATPLTLSNVPLDREKMEARLHSILGRFLIAFARIELNLTLRVGNDKSFCAKLERLRSSVLEVGDNDEAVREILAWVKAADSLREIRNLVAHGRWGYLVHLQQVALVSGYPPAPQPERHFSLDELAAIVSGAESLGNALSRLPALSDSKIR
jgi:hypothetical protein